VAQIPAGRVYHVPAACEVVEAFSSRALDECELTGVLAGALLPSVSLAKRASCRGPGRCPFLARCLSSNRGAVLHFPHRVSLCSSRFLPPMNSPVFIFLSRPLASALFLPQPPLLDSYIQWVRKVFRPLKNVHSLLPLHWKCARLCFDRRVFIYLFVCV